MFWWQPFCALTQQSVVCPQFCYFPHFSAACNLLLLQSFISGLLRVRLLNTEILSDSRYAEIRRVYTFAFVYFPVLNFNLAWSGTWVDLSSLDGQDNSQGLGKSSGRLGRGQDHSELPMSVQFESNYFQNISVYFCILWKRATEATGTSKPAFDQIIRY